MKLYKNNTVIAIGEDAEKQRLKKIKSVAKHFTTQLPNGQLKSDYTVRQFNYRTIQTSRNIAHRIETENNIEDLKIENYFKEITHGIL